MMLCEVDMKSRQDPNHIKELRVSMQKLVTVFEPVQKAAESNVEERSFNGINAVCNQPPQKLRGETRLNKEVKAVPT